MVSLSVMALAVTATTPVFAGEMAHSVRPDLRAAQQRLAWEARNSKGVQRETLNSEERKLDAMIDDLEHGRSVNPAEVDRALERAERGSF